MPSRFLCAGDAEAALAETCICECSLLQLQVFSSVTPALDSMAQGKTYFGEEVGDASIMKLVVNPTELLAR